MLSALVSASKLVFSSDLETAGKEVRAAISALNIFTCTQVNQGVFPVMTTIANIPVDRVYSMHTNELKSSLKERNERASLLTEQANAASEQSNQCRKKYVNKVSGASEQIWRPNEWLYVNTIATCRYWPSLLKSGLVWIPISPAHC